MRTYFVTACYNSINKKKYNSISDHSLGKSITYLCILFIYNNEFLQTKYFQRIINIYTKKYFK